MPQENGQNSALRVVILNQYYVPDIASTGHLLHELATDLAARGVGVSVITSHPSYGPRETWQPCPSREQSAGVDIMRLTTTRFSKDNSVGRILNSTTFLTPLTLRMLLRRQRGEVFLYTTNPPYLGIIGALVSLIRRHPYFVLLHDSYPQIAVLVGKIRPGGFIERAWHAMNRFIYRRAKQTIVLCEAAKKLVCETYKIDPSLVHVVHNWADEAKLQPKPKAQSEFARTHGLSKPFTVLYSGNLGLYYEFDTIIGAAERLKNEPFRLVFVGAGGKRGYIEDQIRSRGLTNVLLLPYQPFNALQDSLNACDASLVTIANGVEGISFPSKLYTSLAVGKPILALSESWSELRRIVEDNDVGTWTALGDVEGLANQIRAMMANPARCEKQGQNARRLLERQFTIAAATERYAEVLAAATGDPAITESMAEANARA